LRDRPEVNHADDTSTDPPPPHVGKTARSVHQNRRVQEHKFRIHKMLRRLGRIVKRTVSGHASRVGALHVVVAVEPVEEGLTGLRE